MAAMYDVRFEENGQRSSVLFHAADAKSMKRSALRAAYANLRKRFNAKMKRQGRKVKYIGARCVG